MTCTHCENCEDCHRSVERLKVALSIKNELRAEVSKRLGVDHLRGEAQLRAAIEKLDGLGLHGRQD